MNIKELTNSVNHWHSILLVNNIIVCPSCNKVSDDPFEYRPHNGLIAYVDMHSTSEVRHLNREYGDIYLAHSYYNDLTAVHTVSYSGEIKYHNCNVCAKEVNAKINIYANGIIEQSVKKVLMWCNAKFNTRVTDVALYTDKSKIGYVNRLKDTSKSTVFINVDRLDPKDPSILVENVLSECSKQVLKDDKADDAAIGMHRRMFTETHYTQYMKEAAQIS